MSSTSSIVYLGSPTWGPRKQTQTPALEGRNVKSHWKKSKQDGRACYSRLQKKEENLPHRPLRIGSQPSAWMMGSHLTPHWSLYTRFLWTRKLIHPAHPTRFAWPTPTHPPQLSGDIPSSQEACLEPCPHRSWDGAPFQPQPHVTFWVQRLLYFLASNRIRTP